MTLSDIKAECERDKARMDSSHERMDKLSSDGASGNPAAPQNTPHPALQYVPQPGRPRPVILAASLFAILVVIFAVVLVFIALPEKSPVDVYKEYVDASNDRDIKRMFDQTVTRFTSDYEQRLDNLSDIVFVLNPEIEILDVGVTYQANLSDAQRLIAQIIVDDVENQLLLQVDDYCYVDYTITITYTDIDQSATMDGDVLCVSVGGRWYLAVPGFY